MTRFKREKFDRNLFSRPQVPGTLRACPGNCRDIFTFYLIGVILKSKVVKLGHLILG